MNQSHELAELFLNIKKFVLKDTKMLLIFCDSSALNAFLYPCRNISSQFIRVAALPQALALSGIADKLSRRKGPPAGVPGRCNSFPTQGGALFLGNSLPLARFCEAQVKTFLQLDQFFEGFKTC